ncbi:MAG: DeoR/GlpR family DNA-binding transcription regulator [Aggregatilineales bacterium]
MADERFVEERRSAIMEQLRLSGRVSVKTLSGTMGVSEATIRNDLRALESVGKLRKTYGGAIRPTPHVQTLLELSFHVRLQQQRKEKDLIGAAAARLVKSGDSIALDASTTAYALVPHLKQLEELTVVTNSLPIATEFFDSLHVQVFMPGGKLRRDSLSLVGRPELLPNINLNLGFFGAVGIDESGGVTDIDPGEVSIKQAMIERCAETIIIADSTKWGRLAPYTVIPTERIRHIISTELADKKLVGRFRAMRVKVGLVGMKF